MRGVDLVTVFLVFWSGLAIAGFFLFFVSKKVSFKKRYFHWYLILGGVLFLGFIMAAEGSWGMFAFAAPFVVLILYWNFRLTRFCESCGRTIIDPIPFSRAEFCPTCGVRLDSSSGQG